MAYKHIVIDGYSLLHACYPDDARSSTGRDWEQQRDALTAQLSDLSRSMGAEITVVFDGQGRAGSARNDVPGVRILYTSGHRSADDHIERMVYIATQPEQMLVVTSDHAIQDTVRGRNAGATHCAEFMRRMDEARRDRNHSVRRVTQRRLRSRLGDFFPE